MNPSIWNAAERAWNAGRDPLEDPVVLALLEEHPEDLAALLALQERLEQLPEPAAKSLPFLQSLPRSAVGGVLVAAASIAAVLSLPHFVRGPVDSGAPGETGEASATAVAEQDARPYGRVLDLEVTITTTRADSRATIHADAERLTVHSEHGSSYRSQVRPLETP